MELAGILFLLGLFLGGLIFTFVMFFLGAWATSKILKSGRQDIRSAGRFALYSTLAQAALLIAFAVVFYTISALVAGGSDRSLIALILLLIAGLLFLLLWLYAMLRITMKAYVLELKKAAIFFIVFFVLVFGIAMVFSLALGVPLIVGVVMWQLGVFMPEPSTVTSGWVKVQPLEPTINYDDEGQFTCKFMNTAGTYVRIDSAAAAEKVSGTACEVSPIQTTVRAGNGFAVEASCPAAGLSAGDTYEMELKIEYTAVIGGISTIKTETGRIRGVVEQSSGRATIIESDRNTGVSASSKGWARIQPLAASTGYDSGTQVFTASFTNAVGVPVRIQSVKVVESSTGTECRTSQTANQTVSTGYALKVTSLCEGAEIQGGDPYSMDIEIEYSTVVGGLATSHTEKGSISGRAA